MSLNPEGDQGTVSVPRGIGWAGRTQQGNFVDDGSYPLSVSVTDTDGQSAESEPVKIVVGNTPPTVHANSEYQVFSPGGNDQRNVVPIRQQGTDGATWSGVILTDDGTAVRRWDWLDSLPERVEWDGRNSDGEVVPDGRYSYALTARDAAGNNAIDRQNSLRVSTVVRNVSVTSARRYFSPNGDGTWDTVEYEIDLSGDAEIREWDFVVLNRSGETVEKRTGEGEVPTTFEFCGRSGSGALPEGEYRGRLTILQRNGERQEATSRAVVLDETAPDASAQAGADTAGESITVSQSSACASFWKAPIVPADQEDSILSVEWDSDLPQEFVWNGQTESGDSAATGQYRYVLQADDRAGNRTTVETEPRPYFPATDGTEREIRISVETSDRSKIKQWQVTIYDPHGGQFAQFGGEGKPPEPITWDGRGDNGNLPESARDYTAAVTVTDDVGNQSTTERTVPVGIVVERDPSGDLQFSITGIRFAAFEADFENLSDQDVVSQNKETLDRIAQQLERYPQQDVLIEGHAVHIFYREPRVEREQEQVLLPLSEERAQAVLDALVERGVDEDRLTAVGRGGSEPLVPHGDMQNRWKNRRVEFELQ